MPAADVRSFKRCDVSEELRQHTLLVIGLAVCENDDVNVAALGVTQC